MEEEEEEEEEEATTAAPDLVKVMTVMTTEEQTDLGTTPVLNELSMPDALQTIDCGNQKGNCANGSVTITLPTWEH